MRAVRPLAWVTLLALVVATAALYPSLPAEIPGSIDASGRARHFVARSPLMWGLPVIMAVLIAAFNEWLRRRLPAKPELFNFPGKEELLKLPAEYRTGAIAQMQQFLDLVTLEIAVTFALVQWMIWRGAHGVRSEQTTLVLLVMPTLLLVGMGLFLGRIQTAVDEGRRKWESRRNPLR